MSIYDTISLWIGRGVLAAGAGWLAWSVVVVLCLTCRDTYTGIRNMLDYPKEWWRWAWLPTFFLRILWDQTKARWHGYEVELIRVNRVEIRKF